MSNEIVRVTRFMTADGVEHTSEEEAKAHVEFCSLIQEVQHRAEGISLDHSRAIAYWVRQHFVRKEG
jgi:hypothetical protein